MDEAGYIPNDLLESILKPFVMSSSMKSRPTKALDFLNSTAMTGIAV